MNDINKRIAALSPEQRALFELRLKQKGLHTQQSTSIPKRTSEPLYLSLIQERLWFLHQLQTDIPLYNESSLFRLTGQLNSVVLEQSLNEIIKRHEIIRTHFQVVDGQPVQIITPRLTITLPVIDLQELSEIEQEAKIKQIAIQVSGQPFDLTQGLLLRGTLIRLREQEHIMLLTMHHIISDGWSWRVFYRELATLYQAFCNGSPSPLPELPIQYADFALWQRQSKEDERDRQLAYWKQQLDGAAPALALPTDYPRPASQSFRGARETLILPQTLTNALKSLSQQESVTLFMTLLAAFKTLLYRYTEQEDLLVGTPIANRNQIETENLLGCFVNTLVLRTNFSSNPSFRELLGRVRETTLAAYAHQDLPFEQLIKELQPQRALSHTPLFQVMFVFQDAPLDALKLPGLTLTPLIVDSGIAKFDLTLFLEDTKHGLMGALEYNTDLFKADTITRMLGHFQVLLESIVTNPNQNLSDLPLLTPAERHQLLVEFNQHSQAEPGEFVPRLSLHQLFEAQVERTPDAVAVVFADEQLTYRELNCRANQLAHYLQLLGVKPEVRVCICLERSLLMVVGLLGILKAGGAYIPIDPNYPPERIEFILTDAQAPLLTQQRLLAQLPERQAQFVCLDTDWDKIAQHRQDNPINKLTPDNLAYIIYTSGSTGKPKGAMNTHRGICNRLLWMQSAYQLTETDSVLQKTPFSFDVSVWEFFWPLLTGARLVVAQPGGHQDSAYLVKLIAEQGITTLHFVPSMLQVFLAEPGVETLTCLKRVICSGEALPLEQKKRYFELLDAELHNLYGPTEAAVDVTFWKCQQDEQPIVPIGRPIANTQIYLLDPHLQPVPIGVPGELHIGGIGLARGYLNRSDLTAEKFIPNLFSDEQGNRLYKTGDLARYLPDGNIEFLGRIDYQVKVRGFRIELGEIESVMSQHPAVRQVVVIREDKSLVAYVVPKQESGVVGAGFTDMLVSKQTGWLNPPVQESGEFPHPPTPPAPPSPLTFTSNLRNFLKERLPEYMVPAAFVLMDALPLTPSGKVDRRALPALLQTRPELEETFVAPRTPVEEMLAGIWCQVLGIEQVGIHDNFFEIGGHSLLATQVISQLRIAFQVNLPLRRLFEAPTVASLAEHIQTAIASGSGRDTLPIQRVSREARLPLSFAQQRLWFLQQLEPSNPAYNGSTAVLLKGSLNVSALEQSINAIVQRHEALRTSFAVVEGQPVQIVHPSLDVRLATLDFFPPDRGGDKIQNFLLEEAQKPFDLTQAPLLRVSLLRSGKEEHLLLLTIHHIVSDAWSRGVFIREFAALYEAFSQGQPSPLPELPIQYADFAVWQRQWLQGVLETQLAYWKQQLGANPPVLELPIKQSRGAEGQRGRGAEESVDSNSPLLPCSQGALHCFAFSPTLTQSLKTLSQRSGVTLFMTLLAAFKALLYHYTSQADIVVGSPIANRNRSEIEALIGFFVNTLVLRTDLSGNPSFREVLGRVREVALGAYAHQDLPFEKLVGELQPERNLSHSPLFRVWFVLQNAPMPTLELPGLTLTLKEVESGSVRHDLKLDLTETPEGLKGFFEYKTELFEARAIAQMAGLLETLLHTVVEQPDIQLSALVTVLADAEKQQQLAKEQEFKAASRQKLNMSFKNIRRKAVSVSPTELVTTELLQPGEPLPLVIQPAVEGLDLTVWAKNNRQWLETQLLQHGGILFRFKTKTVAELEQLVRAISGELLEYSYRSTPRSQVSGNIYTSTEYPPEQSIPLHNEMAYSRNWPMKIWFFCIQAAQQGGATPIANSRKVFERLNPMIKELFIQKQVMYVRNYGEGLDLPWQTVFQTTNKSEVEAYCRNAGIDFEWRSENHLRTRQVCQAIATHPKTGDIVWFNQAHLFHVSSLDPEVRSSLLSVIKPEDLPRNAYYGDGSTIEDSVLDEIRGIYQQEAVTFPWQSGDILMLDNMLTAHGRTPFVGSRKVVVAMAEPFSNKDS